MRTVLYGYRLSTKANSPSALTYNPHKNNPDKVIHLGKYNNYFDDLKSIALAPNTRKFVLNFWDEDLEMEYRRIKALNISDNMTEIRYVCNVAPYYYFSFTDPDGNIIEVTGNYTPKENEFVELLTI